MPVSYELLQQVGELEAPGREGQRNGVRRPVCGGRRTGRAAAAAASTSMWNQEREKAGLAMPMTEDTTGAVKVGIEAMKRIIAADLENGK